MLIDGCAMDAMNDAELDEVLEAMEQIDGPAAQTTWTYAYQCKQANVLNALEHSGAISSRDLAGFREAQHQARRGA